MRGSSPTMRAAVITKFGPPEVLQIRDLHVPSIGVGDVLVRTRAIGLNFAEVFARLGYYPGIPKPPFVPGIEFSGVVDATGASVRGIKKGDRVFGFSKHNAYAEFVAVPREFILRMPRTMSFEDAAAFGVASLTAYHGLVTLAHLMRGERLLIHAAAGGVGTAALQIARHLGATIFATVGSEAKRKIVEELGAKVVINYSRDDFAAVLRNETKGEGLDVIFDSVGGRLMRKGWKLLAPMGRYVLFGFAAVANDRGVNKFRALQEAMSVPLIYPPSLVTKNVSLMGFNLYFLAQKTKYLRTVMEQLLRWYAKGILRPVVGSVFPFDKIAEAQAFLQSRKSVGKVVVTVA
ncbi:MAG: zinc-binding dehydrogenase [Ignavibacteriales bacterium]|nr:zinc-binding dehydrogenase [Ignavibacteriales bacterium]